MGTSTSNETKIEIRIWQHHWECGGGCCSDSYWMAEILVDGYTRYESEPELYSSAESMKLEVIHQLQKIFT